MSQLLSGKVKVVRPSDVSENRYEYLRLGEAEPNLGVPESGSLSSGSIALVASDADGNRLFVTTLQLDQVTGSFSGSFAGDGSELNNLPDVQQLRSGSVSASIAPNTGFLVNVSSSIQGDLDVDGTARITGDLIVDNRIVARELIVEIISSSILFSTGSNIFGDELTDKQEFTGSVEMTGSLSVDGDTNISGGLFVTGGNVQLSSGSFFSGSGEGLFNIPKSALTDDALLSNLITTGSVTASVSTDGFFRVFSTGSVTTELSGSLLVSGNVNLISGSSFSGSGENLFNIPRTALVDDALLSNLIATGSVTASVSTDGFFRVQSTGSVTTELSGSLLVSGNVEINSGSSFSGSGENLFNIPRSALVDDALISNLITTGSVTASVSTDGFFRVEGTGSITSEFSGSVSISESLDVPIITADKITSDEFTGSFSGSFAGDGSQLNNIPQSALSEDASRIASGSATASISPNLGFEVNTSASIDGDLSVTGRITAEELFVNFISSSIIYSSGSNIFGDDSGSDVQKIFGETQIFGNVTASGVISSSGFVGDGSELFNIPQSALSDNSPLIASGAVTASTENDIFTVISVNSGSIFSCSIEVSGSVQLTDGFAFSGSGENLFNIPQSALSEDATRIASGSATASISPNLGFVVNTSSSFDGNVTVTENGFFSGSGAGLFDIPLSAITEEAFRIVSGSVTASVDPAYGFRVNDGAQFSGSLIASSSRSAIPTGSLNTIFNVTNEGSSNYAFSGAISGSDPSLTLVKNVTYTFNIDANGHPFYIKGQGDTDVNNALTGSQFEGQNGTDSGSFTFTPTGSNTIIYYNCSVHSGMGNSISLVDVVYENEVPHTFIGSVNVDGNQTITGSLITTGDITTNDIKGNIIIGSIFSGSGESLFNIPLSALAEDVVQRTFIASGSITASVSPVDGFVVNTSSSFEGSVDIFGDTAITGGLIVSNSLVELQNIPITQSVSVSGSKFIINNKVSPLLKLVRENSYYFDLSDTSNVNNTLRLSTFSDGIHNAGTEYTSFVTSGSAAVGNEGAYLQIIVTGSTP